MDNVVGLHRENVTMETFTGKLVMPLDLCYEEIDIVDIAHHLSLICRFNGACRKFYSVAQHSILVAGIVPKGDRLAALLHDASEAYMADVIRPIKQAIPGLKIIEDRIEVRILAKFKCSGADWKAIKRADNILLATEARDLLPLVEDWMFTEKPLESVRIVPWTARQAEKLFLKRFKEYGGQNDH